MTQAFSDAIKEAFAVCPVNKVILDTLEIRQDGVQDPIYMVRSRRRMDAADENGIVRHFEPVGFQFSLPPSSDEGFQSLNIAIDNVGLRVTNFVKAALSQVVSVQAVYRPYLSDDLSRPQMIPPLVLFLKNLSINDLQVTGQATFMDIINKPFPKEIYTRDRFPALG